MSFTLVYYADHLEDALVATLVTMGYESVHAQRALSMCGNDFHAALDLLESRDLSWRDTAPTPSSQVEVAQTQGGVLPLRSAWQHVFRISVSIQNNT